MATGMTIGQMLGQSGILTLLGMGVVFSFLIMLILCMYLLHAVIHALGLDKTQKKDSAGGKEASSPSPAASAPAQDTGAVVAAIAAALHEKQS